MVTGSSGLPKRRTHSSITCTSRSSPKLAEELLAGLLHLFPGGIGIHDQKAIGHGAAAAQGHSQIVNGIGAKVQRWRARILPAPVPSRGRGLPCSARLSLWLGLP